jgi:hypothetical protein
MSSGSTVSCDADRSVRCFLKRRCFLRFRFLTLMTVPIPAPLSKLKVMSMRRMCFELHGVENCGTENTEFSMMRLFAMVAHCCCCSPLLFRHYVCVVTIREVLSSTSTQLLLIPERLLHGAGECAQLPPSVARRVPLPAPVVYSASDCFRTHDPYYAAVLQIVLL